MEGYTAGDPHLEALMNTGLPAWWTCAWPTRPPSQEGLVERYRAEDAAPLAVDRERIAAMGLELVERPVASEGGNFARHDPDKLAAAVLEIYRQPGGADLPGGRNAISLRSEGMTFGGEVKNELCRAGLSRKCCAQAEAYGVLLYCNTFCGGEIRIVTEHEAFAQRLPALVPEGRSACPSTGFRKGRASGCFPSRRRTSCGSSTRPMGWTRRAWRCTLTSRPWRSPAAARPSSGARSCPAAR